MTKYIAPFVCIIAFNVFTSVARAQSASAAPPAADEAHSATTANVSATDARSADAPETETETEARSPAATEAPSRTASSTRAAPQPVADDATVPEEQDDDDNVVDDDGQPLTAGRRHRGFYFRTHVGGGYRSVSASISESTLKISGGGIGFGVAMGGAATENLIIYGELFVDSASDPTIETDEGSVEAKGIKSNFVALGPGVTYYIMPANVHIGGSVVLCQTNISNDSQTIASSDWGFGGVFRIGKDFWVSRKVGLGIMGQFAIAQMKDSEAYAGEIATLTSTNATLALELTYN
ncbi:MAG: hypothetical protein ACOY0T_11405 [Myxococcota bacterium]